MNKKQKLLLIIGLLMSTTTQIAMHYRTFPDGVYGTFSGIGLGCMILALFYKKHTSA